MLRPATSPSRRSLWTLLLGLLCIALVLLGGTLSATHTHAIGDPTHADCGLCASAHTVVHITAPAAHIPLTEIAATPTPSLPPARPRTLFRSALYTRPPPANASLT